MSKNEDYLDDLLNSVSGRNNKEDITQLLDTVRENEERAIRDREAKKRRRNIGAYHDFEQELSTDEDDDFIRSFELELDAEAADRQMEDIHIKEDDVEELPIGGEIHEEDSMVDYDSTFEEPQYDGASEEPQYDDMMQSIDGIMDGVKKMVEDTEASDTDVSDTDVLGSFGFGEESVEEPAAKEEIDIPDSLFADETLFADTSVMDDSEMPMMEMDMGMDDLPDEEKIQDEAALETAMNDGSDDGLLDLLSGLTEDSELSDIEALLKADESGEEIADESGNNEMEMLESIKELADINPAKKKKKGFFSRVMSALFGEDDELTGKKKVAEEGTLESISDENLDILRELDSADQKEAKKGSGKKKKDKKEKKEKKEKKVKEPKPKKEKKPKPPKEKKPKEPDLTPPLPKKPVILMAVMAASVFLLILLGSNYVGYSGDVAEAKTLYKKGDYVAAYSAIAGLDVKEKDEALYQQCAIMAMIQEEYEAYVVLMDAGQYSMALDALIRGIGRYDKFYERAEEYGILMEYGRLEEQIEQMLDAQFDVTPQEAREMYGLRRRDEYSIRLRQVLEKLGLEK